MRAGEMHPATADRMPAAIRYGEAEDVRPVEQLAVGDRLAVPSGTSPAALAEEHAALRLAGHIAAGDVGAVRRFVNELEHGRGPWDVDPWRLVEHLADLTIRQRARESG
jgi:hypothetical protein